MCQVQAEEAEGMDPGFVDSQEYSKEQGVVPFIRRLLILNSGKLMAVCIFAIITQQPWRRQPSPTW